MKPKIEDVPRITAKAQRLAELLAQAGETAYRKTGSWQTNGLRSPNLDPSTRGSRYDKIDGERADDGGDLLAIIPNDPTGEAILTVDKVGPVHDRYRADLAALNDLCDRLNATLLAVDRAAAKPANSSKDELAADGWCTSCSRNGNHMEPLTERKGGGFIYADVCRWCGDFRREEGTLPPVALLRLRHTGRRISTADVQRALSKSR